MSGRFLTCSLSSLCIHFISCSLQSHCLFLFLISGLFLRGSSTDPVGDDSMFLSQSSLDDIDSSSNIFEQADLNDNLTLEASSGSIFLPSDSRVDSLDGFSSAPLESKDFPTVDSDLLVTNSNCPSTHKRSYKRKDVTDTTCPAEASPPPPPLQLTLPTLQLPGAPSSSNDAHGKINSGDTKPIFLIHGDEDPEENERDYEEGNFDNRCPGIWLINRVLDFCCHGPLSPFVIDPFGRLVYRYIKKCTSSTSDHS